MEGKLSTQSTKHDTQKNNKPQKGKKKNDQQNMFYRPKTPFMVCQHIKTALPPGDVSLLPFFVYFDDHRNAWRL